MNSISFISSISQFMALVHRDIHMLKNRIWTYVINYGMIYPIVYTFCFAYLQTRIYFGPENITLRSTLFIGNILLVMLILIYKLTVETLLDLESHKFVAYLANSSSCATVIVERIIFISIFSFLVLVPFYPFAKLLLGTQFDTTHAWWPGTFLVLLCSCWFCTSYCMCAMVYMPTTKALTNFWTRVNQPLFTFGGFWIPLATLSSYSPVLGYLSYANPFIYITEGLRRSLLANPNFLNLYICCSFLSLAGIILTILAIYLFKKRLDCVK
ncbi:hypothetical protein J120_00930 [candidate division TM6 bacterium JCVI TM6SC1]|uniref:ABC-2 type transporter transmembrane domain-containing protein n=1 Tax=candidate division TM6 bacterium JCVI TM6SC1 TaxID=1306947 RepID=A0A0D2JEN3_9BACT|nr:hypothetical protein J120_00930 [candidate division TM6 bacterium JCVI TM6SC1]